MTNVFTGTLPNNPINVEGNNFNHEGLPAQAPAMVNQYQNQARPAGMIPPQSPIASMAEGANFVRPNPRQQSQALPQPLPISTFQVRSKAKTEQTVQPQNNEVKGAAIKTLANGFNILPKTREEAIEFAKFLSTSQFIPADIRSTPSVDRSADVFLLLALGTSKGMSIGDCLANIFVLPGKTSRIGLYVRAKEGLCTKYGVWDVTIDTVNAVATATGTRYDNGVTKVATYTGNDARLRGLMEFQPDAGWFGCAKGMGAGWSDKWPDMLKVRAIGRLLDALFPDVIGGFVSREEMEDEQAFMEAQLAPTSAKPQAEALEESDKDTTARIKRALKSRKKAPAEDQKEEAHTLQVEPQVQEQPQVQIISEGQAVQTLAEQNQPAPKANSQTEAEPQIRPLEPNPF